MQLKLTTEAGKEMYMLTGSELGGSAQPDQRLLGSIANLSLYITSSGDNFNLIKINDDTL
jgi:hypothetical protein